MRGGTRNKLPAAIRTLKGARTREHHRHEPTGLAVAEGLVPPRHLTADERELWDYYAPILSRVRVMTEADVDALIQFVEARGQVQEIKRQQMNPEYTRVLITVTVDGAGNERVRAETNPLDVQRRAWTDKARLCGAELGLSPMSRARVSAVEPVAEPDEVEKILRRVK